MSVAYHGMRPTVGATNGAGSRYGCEFGGADRDSCGYGYGYGASGGYGDGHGYGTGEGDGCKLVLHRTSTGAYLWTMYHRWCRL